MTTFDETDRRIARWFAEDDVRAPARTVDAVLAHARAHPRRPDPLAPLRRDPMGRSFGGLRLAPVPLLAAMGLLVLTLVGAAVAGGLVTQPAPVVTPPPPTVSPPTTTAAPTPVVFAVDLIEVVGADATVDVTDRSGRVIAAESGRPADGGSVAVDVLDIQPDPADPTVVELTWTGTPCDTTHALDVAPDGVTFTMTRAPCEGDAIPRDLVLRLRFVDPVDVAAMTGRLITS